MKTISRFLFAACLSGLITNNLTAQVAINNSAANPNASAILDLNTGNAGNKGFLAPQASLLSNIDVATIPSPATGLIIYNTNASMTNGATGYYYWSGTTWISLGSPIGGSGTNNYVARWTPNGNILGKGLIQDNGTGAGISSSIITPMSILDVKGNISVGAYAGVNAAPANGVIISGNVGVGTPTPAANLEVDGSSGSTIKIVDGNQAAGKVLTSDANGQGSWQNSSCFTNWQLFISTSTFTVPVGVTTIKVDVWGAGGGGGGSFGGGFQWGAGGGGAGGYAEGIYTVVPATVYTCTIGGYGSGGPAGGNNGTNGGTSSFGALISATGGFGGNASTNGGGDGTGNGGYYNTSLGFGGTGGNAYESSNNYYVADPGNNGGGNGGPGGNGAQTGSFGYGGGGGGGGIGGSPGSSGLPADANSGGGGGGGGSLSVGCSGGAGSNGKIIVFW